MLGLLRRSAVLIRHVGGSVGVVLVAFDASLPHWRRSALVAARAALSGASVWVESLWLSRRPTAELSPAGRPR
jgi:hypothetical protein